MKEHVAGERFVTASDLQHAAVISWLKALGAVFFRTGRNVCYTEGQMLNSLKPRGNYMYHILYQSVMLYFVFVGFV
jgi:hypothetical protein